MDKSELGKLLAATRPVVEKVCEAPDCGNVYRTMKPKRSRWCSDRCRFKNRTRRAAHQPEGSDRGALGEGA